MADVSNTIPGLGICLEPKMPERQTCDLCQAPATVRMQGETDSMGCEWLDHCDHHHARVTAGAWFGYCQECDSPDAVEISKGHDGAVVCEACRV